MDDFIEGEAPVTSGDSQNSSKKIKRIAEKLDDGSFSFDYPIGADAENVDLKDGTSVEDKINSIDTNITELRNNLNDLPENILYAGEFNTDEIEIPKLNADLLEGKDANYFVAKKNISNENLVFNSNFNHVINQRRATEWTTDYGIDRWCIYTGKCVIDDNGRLTFNRLNGNGVELVQRFESYEPFSNQTVTISVKKDGIIYSHTYNIPDLANNAYDSEGLYLPNFIIDLYREEKTNHYFSLRIFSHTDSDATDTVEHIDWIKMEHGDVATSYEIPDPAIELLKCQRYFYGFSIDSDNYMDTVSLGIGEFSGNNTNNTTLIPFSLPTRMRVDPTFLGSFINGYRYVTWDTNKSSAYFIMIGDPNSKKQQLQRGIIRITNLVPQSNNIDLTTIPSTFTFQLDGAWGYGGIKFDAEIY